MTSKSAAELTFLAAGTISIASSIPNAVAFVVFALSSTGNTIQRWTPLVSAAVAGTAGVCLIAFRKSLAEMFAPPEANQEADGTPDLHAAALSVIGVYFFASGVSYGLREAIVFNLGNGPWRASTGNIAEPVADAVVGLALFLGSRGLVGLWRALRER